MAAEPPGQLMPGSRCTVCDHPDRKAIEIALPVTSVRDIAGRFGLSKSAVGAHKLRHIQPAVARAIARREDLSAESLLRKLEGYLGEAEHGIEIAKSLKDLPGLARCIKEARETAVYLGKTIGLWSDKPSTIIDARRQTVNIASLTTDELRSLASLASGRSPVLTENVRKIAPAEQLGERDLDESAGRDIDAVPF